MNKNLLSLLAFIFLIGLQSETYADSNLQEISGMKTTINSVDIQVQFYSPGIVRVVKSEQGADLPKESLSVVKEPEDVALQFRENDKEMSIISSSINVSLNKETGALIFYNSENQILISEKNDGAVINPKKYAGFDVYNVKQSFQLDPDEFIYGLGQLQQGKMSQRGQEVFLKQGNKETVIPFILSNKGYGVFWDNYSPTKFADKQDETFFDSEIGQCIDYYLMIGDNADGVINPT